MFYDGDHNYLGHWIERPSLANDEMEGLRGMLSGVERGTPQFDEARAPLRRRDLEAGGELASRLGGRVPRDA